MIAYVTLGSNDLSAAERFYCALLEPLGYGLRHDHGDLSFCLPTAEGTTPAPPDLYIKRPFDGGRATVGNGTMVAFEAESAAQVDALHKAACRAGGTSDGAPGLRPDYGTRFYVGYLRDPDGNKIALYSMLPHTDAPKG